LFYILADEFSSYLDGIPESEEQQYESLHLSLVLRLLTLPCESHTDVLVSRKGDKKLPKEKPLQQYALI